MSLSRKVVGFIMCYQVFSTDNKYHPVLVRSTQNWTRTTDGNHIIAADEFLGNQQRSYGQTLRFLVKSEVQVSIPLSGHSAVIMEGNGQWNCLYFRCHGLSLQTVLVCNWVSEQSEFG